MTPDELEIHQIRIRADVAEQLLVWLAGTLWAFRKCAGEPLQSQMLNEMEESLSFARRHHELQTIPGVSAAESDMLTSEFLEAFDALSEVVFRHVKTGQ